jgi:hypothetical protein
MILPGEGLCNAFERFSGFGANPLRQTIGLGQAKRLAVLDISWPTSGTRQVIHDVAVNQAIEVTELNKEYRRIDRRLITWSN